MDYRKKIYFFYLTIILWAKVITGQNVQVGTADFQIGKRAQIDCAFGNGIVASLFWRFSTTDVHEVPTDNTIIKYTVFDNITIPDTKYKGHVQLTAEYSLVFNKVNETDRALRYWCEVNVGGFSGEHSTNVTKIDPVAPGEFTNNCEQTSKCKTGNLIYCTVSCFNPSDDFNLKWTVDDQVRSGTTAEVTLSTSGNCYDGKSTYTIGENDEIGTRNFKCEPVPEGRAYQYATPGEYSLSQDIQIVKEMETTTKKPTTKESRTQTLATQSSNATLPTSQSWNVTWAVNRTYIESLANSSSDEYIMEAENQTNAMDGVFNSTEDYLGSNVTQFSNGSIVTDFQILLDIDSSLEESDITLIIQTAIDNGDLSSIGVINGSVEVSVNECDYAELHDCSENEDCEDTDPGYICKCKEGYDCVEDGLTLGQKLGIGLGVAAGCVVVICIIGACCYMNRKPKVNKVGSSTEMKNESDDKNKTDKDQEGGKVDAPDDDK